MLIIVRKNNTTPRGLNFRVNLSLSPEITSRYSPEAEMLINILIQWRFIIKTFLQTLFFYLLLTQICLAQWVVYQPVTDLNQNNVCYAGADQISIVCDKGLVLETINSEVFWNQLQSTNNSNLNTIFFVDDNNGFIVRR